MINIEELYKLYDINPAPEHYSFNLKEWAILYHKEYLIDEYSPENEYPIDAILYNSKRPVKWICSKCGMEWTDLVSNRTHQTHPSSCPKCEGRVRNDGSINSSLKSKCPELIEKEWSKSNKKSPDEISIGSPYEAKWICPLCNKEHVYKVEKKTRGGKKVCNDCRKKYLSKVSFPVYAINYYLTKLGFETKLNEKINNSQFDIWIENSKIAIKYDSYFNKTQKNFDIKVDEMCKQNNINLIRIRSYDIKMNFESSAKIIQRYSRYDLDLSRVIKELINTIDPNNEVEVDVVKDNYNILSMAKDMYVEPAKNQKRRTKTIKY